MNEFVIAIMILIIVIAGIAIFRFLKNKRESRKKVDSYNGYVELFITEGQSASGSIIYKK